MSVKTVCIKIGGSTVDAEGLLRELGQSISTLLEDSFPIIVHGGGKDIARHLKLLNREFTFIEGMRVTDAEMVKIVQMVLSGDVNKKIVNSLLLEGVPAVGLSGVDCSLLTASKLYINGKDIVNYAKAVADKFPEQVIYLSGCQTANIKDKPPQNVKVIASPEEFRQELNRIAPL